MALLYEEIMKVPGLTGSWKDRLNTFGKNIYGNAYSGSYNQNIDLYNRIKSGNYGATAAPQAAPAATPTVTPPTIRTPFTELLPFEKAFNPGLISALAESQINPEIARQRADAANAQQRGFAQSGSFRSGYAPFQQQQLADQYERARKEQVQSFSDTINNLANDWYTKQQELYGKNPSAYVMPTVPTFDEFMKSNSGLANLYGNLTSVPASTYKSPFTS